MENQKASKYRNPVVPWWLVLIEGVAAIIVGLALLFRPAPTTLLLVQFLGIYWLISGIISLASLFWDRTEWGWKLANGIIGILAGAVIIAHPLVSTLLVPTTLAIIIAIGGIIIGVVGLIQAFRGGGWGIGVLGALSILLGILLLANPVITGMVLPWLLGGFLIVGCILALLAAFGLASARDKLDEDLTQGAIRRPTSTAGAAETAEAVAATPAEESVVQEEETASAAPVESDLTGNVDPADPTEMAKFKYELEYVEGIGPVYAGRLKAIGLVTCLDLLKAGSTRKGREEITAKAEIPGALILKWVNHVDLYRVKGVGSEYADLLEASGVDTVVELAQRVPSNLLSRMLEVNAQKKLVRQPPTAAQTADWVAQAKGLPRVVSY